MLARTDRTNVTLHVNATKFRFTEPHVATIEYVYVVFKFRAGTVNRAAVAQPMFGAREHTQRVPQIAALQATHCRFAKQAR